MAPSEARHLLGVETAIDPFTTVFLHKGIVNFRIQEWKWFNTTSTDPYHSNFAIQSSRKRVCQNQAAKSSDKRHLEWINRYKYYMIYHHVHMNSQFLTEKWYKALTNHHASLAKKNNSMWHLHREKNKTSIRFSSQKSSTSKLILTNASASPNTIDGSEIRRSPVDMENLPFFAGSYTSQVVQDVFHQQYLSGSANSCWKHQSFEWLH